MNTWLFNEDTAIKTLKQITELGIKQRGGDELGKTIIFARSKKHAKFLKDCFLKLDKELYGNDYLKVITHGEPKAEEFLERFCDEEKDRFPRICISVDMMDTGIDAPSCVNLVFYKPVKSFAKFWQMVGRGSRLRPNLFGEGKDKTHFLIFDLCGNFDFFEEKPNGTEASTQKSLTEIVFGLRIQLAEYLKDGKFKNDKDLQEYRVELLDGLFGDISSLDQLRFDVRMKLKTVMDYGSDNRELWNHLDKKDVKIINDELASLVKPKKGDTDLARFYDKLLFSLMIKRIETPNTEAFTKSFKLPITKVGIVSKKLLKKTSIPKVNDQRGVIEMPLEEAFWKNDGIKHLEKIRTGIRDLMVYIDPADQKYVISNFEDVVYEPVERERNTAGEDEIPEYTSPFKNNVHRLEEIIRNNKDHLTIGRIRSGGEITEAELAELEKMLFENGLSKDDIEKELGSKLDFVKFVIQLVGLSEEKVNESFANFINEFELNSVQIEFLDTIKLFLTKNGKIDPGRLYQAPFKKFHSQGVDGVFVENQADKIFEIINDLNTTSGLGA